MALLPELLSLFWLPVGPRIYNRLTREMTNPYYQHGFAGWKALHDYKPADEETLSGKVTIDGHIFSAKSK